MLCVLCVFPLSLGHTEKGRGGEREKNIKFATPTLKGRWAGFEQGRQPISRQGFVPQRRPPASSQPVSRQGQAQARVLLNLRSALPPLWCSWCLSFTLFSARRLLWRSRRLLVAQSRVTMSLGWTCLLWRTTVTGQVSGFFLTYFLFVSLSLSAHGRQLQVCLAHIVSSCSGSY